MLTCRGLDSVDILKTFEIDRGDAIFCKNCALVLVSDENRYVNIPDRLVLGFEQRREDRASAVYEIRMEFILELSTGWKLVSYM